MNENTARLRDLLDQLVRSHAARGLGEQVVNQAVSAVVTVEADQQYLSDTLAAVLGQSVLPAVLVVADCAATAPEAARYSLSIPTPTSARPRSAAEPVLPTKQTVDICLVPVARARSFGEAVNQAINQGGLRSTTSYLWLLHDDSRPASPTVLEQLLETDRNSPGAKLIGAKQVDWESGHLHNVGYYLTRGSRRASLVVDGEEDQDQYDDRQDVYGVSLAGALVWLPTWIDLSGTDSWYGTFGESLDLARRIYLSGGRVVVAPQAVVAHQRARLSGLRAKDGLARVGLPPRSSYNDRLVARDKFAATQTPLLAKPFRWLWQLLVSLALCVSCLFAKRPYEAMCELVAPWRSLLRLPQALAAKARLRVLPKAERSRVGSLVVSGARLRDWRQREKILAAQQETGQVLSSLELGYLRSLGRRRLVWLLVLVLLGLAAGLSMGWSVLRGIFNGGSLYSAQLAPTAAPLPMLAQTATSMWSHLSGLGVPAAPLPFALVLLLLSLLTGGHLALSIGLFYLLAPAVMMLSFWALAGVVSRSNFLRFATALVWGLLPGGLLGVYQTANLPLLVVLIFLPLSLFLVFRALGMYAVDQPRQPHSSIQAAALAGLMMTFVCAAEPQLILPLFLTFAAFLVVAKSHRAMLLLIPLPSIAVLLPTFFSILIHWSNGWWRQLFADLMIPSQAVQGSPTAAGPLMRAWTLVQSMLAGGQTGWGIGPVNLSWLLTLVLLAAVAVIALCALIALFLPSGLRMSRMAWILVASGSLLAAVAPRVTIGLDNGSPVAASVSPALVFVLLGVLLAACGVTGRHDKPFTLRAATRSGAVRTMADGTENGRLVADQVATQSAIAGLSGFWRVLLAIILCLAALSSTVLVTVGWPTASSTAVMRGSGLPLIAVDDLQSSDGARILGLSAQGTNQIEFSVLRTPVGDLIDRNATSQVMELSGSNPVDDQLKQVAAQLLSANDDAAVAQLIKLGFTGIYVPPMAGSARTNLVAHVVASNGTQEIVNNTSGLYVRLSSEKGGLGRIDVRGQRQAVSDPLRLVWLLILGLLLVAYLIVSIPRRRSVQAVEVEK